MNTLHKKKNSIALRMKFVNSLLELSIKFLHPYKSCVFVTKKKIKSRFIFVILIKDKYL
jgi:hypothetical protein